MIYKTNGIEGKFYGKVFAFPVRIYYEDTDAGGVVYYANYLKFAERARTEYIRALGENQIDYLVAQKCAFMIKHCEVDYKKPAVLDDLLTITCQITELKAASVTIHQEVYRTDELLTTIDVTAVFVDIEKKRPVRIPQEFLTKIDSL